MTRSIRLGMLTPSSNTVLEPLTFRDDVVVRHGIDEHTGRRRRGMLERRIVPKLADPVRYAGTLDAILRFTDDSDLPKPMRHLKNLNILDDYKTGKYVGAPNSWQLNAYRFAEAVLLPDGTEEPMPPIEAGLIREDDAYLYPVRDEIPVMLIGEAIELSQVS